MVMKIIIFLSLIYINSTFSQSITWKDNEITITPQEISRFIAKNLPGTWSESNKVGGLYFKLTPYFFCRREPVGDIFCHLYLKEAEGDLQRMDLDADFGQGSIDNYISDNSISEEKRSAPAEVYIQNEIIHLKFQGILATRLVKRFFPEYETIVEKNNQQFIKHQGKHIQCIHPMNFPDKANCLITVPVNPYKKPNKKKVKESNNQLQ